jgi:hypothetical protein
MSLRTLLGTGYKVSDIDKEHLQNNIFETFGTLAWLIAAKIAVKSADNSFLYPELEKEYIRWKDHLLKMLRFTYGESIEEKAGTKTKEDESGSVRSIAELTDILYRPEPDKDKGDLKKLLKKLQKYFPLEIPAYKDLLEYLINCDYNLISVWTKACTLRSIPEIDDGNIAESVVALLFSPEAILREEAARLIARSGRDLYRTTSDRLPENIRRQLDKIVSDQTAEKELVYEKVRFLSSCFRTIKEDELLLLSDKLLFARNDQKGIYSQPVNSLMWSFPADNKDPEIFVNLADITDPGKIARDIRSECFYCYVLPLNTVTEFNFQYPESSFEIFKYVDSCEA